jgi:hypothetical protein
MRIASGIVAVLLASAALVQANDPDPALWMGAYGAAAVCSGLYAVGRPPVRLAIGGAAACGLGALYLLGRVVWAGAFLDETGAEMIGVVEEGREMLGLWLVASWTSVLAWWGRESRSGVGAET